MRRWRGWWSDDSDGQTDMEQLTLFDYNQLDKETGAAVRQRTLEIRVLMKQTAEDIIHIGRKLIEVKGLLGHGNFGAWLDSEFGWGVHTARNFMRVAETFTEKEKISLFAPSALYLLAAPSTPDDVREEAIERAQSGEVITHKAARKIVDNHKAQPETAQWEAVSTPATSFAFVDDFEQSPIVTAFGEEASEPDEEVAGPYNRVIVGDCLEAMSQLDDGIVQLIVTSPPYPGQRANDMSVPIWRDWMGDCLREMVRLLHPVTGILAFNVMFRRDERGWFDARLFTDIPRMLQAAGLFLVDTYIWTKPNPVPAGNLERTDIPAWEPVFVAARSTQYTFAPFYEPYSPKSLGKLLPGNKARGDGEYTNGHSRISGEGARQSNVLALSSSGENRPRAAGGSFPLGLPERFIRQYSLEGDMVLDPFCGVGTTLVAAQQSGREWLGIEIDRHEAEKAREWLGE